MTELKRMMRALLCLSLFVLSLAADFRYDLLSTKTPYLGPVNVPLAVSHPDQCRPIHFNYLSRHGSREATGVNAYSDFAKLAARLKEAAKNMTGMPQWARDWKPPGDAGELGELSRYGQEELYNTGKRWMAAYPAVFKETYSSNKYPVVSTTKQRCSESAVSFAMGLWEGKGHLGKSNMQPFSLTTRDDEILRFFDACPRYKKMTKDPKVKEPAKLFIAANGGPIVKQVSAKLGLPPTFLSIDEVESLSSACAYEIALGRDILHACSLFDQDSMTILDFWADLTQYYLKSYPNKLGWMIAAPLLNNMLQTIETVVAGATVQKAYMRFAHAETVIPLATLMGLHRDNLTAEDSLDKIKSRTWRGSSVARFAANIAMVTFNCSTPTSPQDFRVKLHYNEQDMKFPGCSSMYCPLKELQGLYNVQRQIKLSDIC